MRSFTGNIVKAGFVLGAFCFVGVAQAATSDGLLADPSIGTADVQVIIDDLVQVTNLNGIDFGTYGGTLDLTGTDEMCIYRNGTGAYDIQLDSANPGAGNEFRMISGANFITYQLKFDDDNDASDGTVFLSGDSLMNQAGHASATDCGSVDNAEIEVFITEATLQGSVAGSYLDTVTLTISPF